MKDLRDIKSGYDNDGFVKFSGRNLLGSQNIDEIIDLINKFETDKFLDLGSESIQSVNDIVYLDNKLMNFAFNETLITCVESLMGVRVELQHSKMINKYPSQGNLGAIKWHQDYPFFPHSNYDLGALALHIDDESEETGSINFLKGSHKQGLFSHQDESGEFMYQINDSKFNESNYAQEKVICESGDFTLHHGNVIHSSGPNIKPNGKRRILYFQFRAQDAIQLDGVLWRCTGLRGSKDNSKKDSPDLLAAIKLS